MSSLKEIAKKYVDSCLSCIPVGIDKMPFRSWKKYQSQLPTYEDIENEFGDSGNIALIGGEVSGGLCCIDIDTKYDVKGDLAKRWMNNVNSCDNALLKRLVIQKTVSGGYHIVYRCKVPLNNSKLAQRATTNDELLKSPHEKVKVLIETRGEGGYFLVDPSDGYSVVKNDFFNIPYITPDEHFILINSAKSLDELPKAKNIDVKADDITPFDAYDSQITNNDVNSLLKSYGWTIIGSNNDTYFLRRPGKNRGLSATYNHVPGRLYVFSTSTQFESETLYKPSAIYSVLVHNGDFSKAAKDLYSKGYGKIEKKVVDVKNTQKPTISKVVRASDIISDIQDIYENGYQSGESSGWGKLDNIYRVVKGQMTIVTGIPSHGKSEWMDGLMVNLSLMSGYKFVVFSPENYPIAIHFQKLAEKYIGCSFLKMSHEQLESAISFMNEHFFFIDSGEDDVGLESVLETTMEIKRKHNIDGLLIDPWNELEWKRPKDMSETDYIGYSLMRYRKFLRKENIAGWIVAHPTKMTKDKDSGLYNIPTLYNISGSAHWYNKADNGIVIYRDFDNNTTKVCVQKVKFKQYGSIGDIELSYEISSGRFLEVINEDSRDW